MEARGKGGQIVEGIPIRGNSKCEETSHYTWEVMLEKNTSELWLFVPVILNGLEVREFQNLKTGGSE